MKAIEIGEDLKALLTQADLPSSNSTLTQYPAISPLLALRVAVNVVSQRTAMAGEFLGFSEDGQRLLIHPLMRISAVSIALMGRYWLNIRAAPLATNGFSQALSGSAPMASI
ncbi:hypothetical protein XM38_047250 [Halomicronema hongdechloris C2206]|uniref:Uncharacterized protein n=1 Tax=Halomicronema hongdechloris C2206 TaxID=1641165 RepID=A0A1Z3HTY3_9CYAN|nr:hypothetical protein [Halomicronema hongdechloris]ASC73753.1 hypothetical protein XM38_047250 [Halomicronema hongdechloris C2206]